MNIFQDCGREGEGGRSLVGVVPAVEVELLDQDDGGRGGGGVHRQHHLLWGVMPAQGVVITFAKY